MVVSLSGLFSEVEKNGQKGPGLEGWKERLLISKRAHLGERELRDEESRTLMPLHFPLPPPFPPPPPSLTPCAVFEFHKQVDEQLELERHKKLGTTKKGIGPTYAAKVSAQPLMYTLRAESCSPPICPLLLSALSSLPSPPLCPLPLSALSHQMGRIGLRMEDLIGDMDQFAEKYNKPIYPLDLSYCVLSVHFLPFLCSAESGGW